MPLKVKVKFFTQLQGKSAICYMYSLKDELLMYFPKFYFLNFKNYVFIFSYR